MAHEAARAIDARLSESL